MHTQISGEKQQQQQQQTWWNLLHPIMDLVIPCWTCQWEPLLFFFNSSPQTITVTGTIICPRYDKVRLCIQEHSGSFPFLLLDLPLHTCDFASHIRHGVTRIVLESNRGDSPESLLSVPTWVMHCNGRRLGFATRRQMTDKDAWLLETMRTVSAGAGILPGKAPNSTGFKYLRGTFDRVLGSDSEAYYLNDPSGCFAQELSVFFLRL
ncbi:hypothetical protein HHK36_010047 [Tetracentron sinense]|uniref:Protein MIZU-KUSSEI 1 n=1 Tax=Tetracentron sinense TaxID=13715 RepID=A0A834ZD53_TETSI|nr:hypothetical protein HHK36_010047 [Tetracentron sinense]